jgi:hypothetical protein
VLVLLVTGAVLTPCIIFTSEVALPLMAQKRTNSHGGRALQGGANGCHAAAREQSTIRSLSPSRSEAVVWTARYLDDCRAKRLAALVETSGRDVWLLHNHQILLAGDERLNKSLLLINSIAGLQHAVQADAPAGRLFTFDGKGHAKSAVMRWIAEHEYDFVWHVEDDAFYTGQWHALFDSVDPNADVIARHIPQGSAGWWRSKHCSIHGGPCNAIQPVQMQWMVARLSKPFATALLCALVTRQVAGHHEALTVAFALRNNFTVRL